LYPIAERYRKGCDVAIKWRSYHFCVAVITELSLNLDGRHRIFNGLLGGGELRIGCEVLGKKGFGTGEVTLGEIERGDGRLVT
jgi:hypothetical protein